MVIQSIIQALEELAPPSLQESYDNCGLITGDDEWECTGIIATLDITEAVILEAKAKGCNMVVAHHPIIFSGIKKLNGKNYVEKAVITAIKNDIAIYAIHTNLDNILEGVNATIADKLDLQSRSILAPKQGSLLKLITYVPIDKADELKNALFHAGAGDVGNYSECSFGIEGVGTFKAGEGTNPFVGEQGVRHKEKEERIEVIMPVWLKSKVVTALFASHPYEEIAYDLVPLLNSNQSVGSGLLGVLPNAMTDHEFIRLLKDKFNLRMIRHTALNGRQISKVAVCGGAGSFLITNALNAKADIFITSDLKYHEFFDGEGKMAIADIGHYESEQFVADLLAAYLKEKFTTFAVLKTEINTNPVHYFI